MGNVHKFYKGDPDENLKTPIDVLTAVPASCRLITLLLIMYKIKDCLAGGSTVPVNCVMSS